jgi:hypothetical protein
MAQVTKTIPQSKLQRYYDLKKLIKESEVEAKALFGEIINMAVDQKMTAQPGVYSFSVTYNKGRCTPAWKEIAIEEAVANGKDAKKFEEEVKLKAGVGNGSYSLEVINRNDPVKV